MKILVAGDFAPRLRISTLIESSNFYCLDEVKPIIQSVDYAIVNFEAPVVIQETRPNLKAGPNLKCSEKAMKSIAYAGFNCVTLANNHFLDYGEVGVRDTLGAIDDCKLDYVGGGLNIESASAILYKEIVGKRIAVINCCEHEFSIATANAAGSNPLNPIQQYYAIQEARANANYVLVIVHGGHEMYQLPSPRMVETYRFFIDAGADAVINHHQHCFSGYEIYQGKPIFYGLGNFCFDSSNRNHIWNKGYMVVLEMGDSVGFNIFPYIQCDKEPVVKILEVDAYAEELKKLNSIIADPQQLQQEMCRFFDSHKMAYQSILEPIRNKYFLSCIRRGIIPSLISKNRKLQAEDYICCESLRDGFISFFSNE